MKALLVLTKVFADIIILKTPDAACRLMWFRSAYIPWLYKCSKLK